MCLAEARARFTARFQFDPKSLVQGSDHISIFHAYGQESPATDLKPRLRIKHNGYGYRAVLDAWAQNGQLKSKVVPLVDGPQELTLQWWNADALRSDAGRARLWPGDIEMVELTGIQNAGETIRLGALGVNGLVGSIYIDEFELWY